jgi:hypothetical protein
MSDVTDKKMIETVISEKPFYSKKVYSPISPRSRDRRLLRAAIVIQRWVRGHQARVWIRKHKEINFKQMRKFRRMLSVAYGKLRTKRIR